MKIQSFHTLILGSGAAGLAAAVRLRAEGVDGVAILTEGLAQGTSINTGSDKQTYYKLGLCGATPDSPKSLAETYLTAGGADGDLALVEAANSTRAFFHLVELGVPFPRDAFGQYVGYKTDHDPAKRATSCGPHTSREMCRALIREAKRLKIKVYEDRVAIKLLATDVDDDAQNVRNKINGGAKRKKIAGLFAISTKTGSLEIYRAENIVFAVGGPGGLYQTSVYPEIHTGAIGLALEIGAVARGLPESQFGLASFTDVSQRIVNKGLESKDNQEISDSAPLKEFRWNVSGTFMQVVPKFVSTAPDGVSDPREFLRQYFSNVGDLFGRVFLKGYQWPFDARKAIDGSSLIDLCVFYETAVLGRRVFLDYRENPQGFVFEELPSESLEYLRKSNALLPTPFARLMRMNPNAVELYREHGIDLKNEPIEIAVCAQHNNGGLAVDAWFRSINVEGLFPIGEVAGTHGIARPGGSALNAGQVGAFRVAEWIGRRYSETISNKKTLKEELTQAEQFEALAKLESVKIQAIVDWARKEKIDWRKERETLRRRMSAAAGIFRSEKTLRDARQEAVEQWERLTKAIQCERAFANVSDKIVEEGKAFANNNRTIAYVETEPKFDSDDIETLRNVQLCLAQNLYLDAIYENVVVGVGSRGSALTLNESGVLISKSFPADWKALPENERFRNKIFFSFFDPKYDADDDRLRYATRSFWRDAKKIPESDEWFENVWRDFREGRIYDENFNDDKIKH